MRKRLALTFLFLASIAAAAQDPAPAAKVPALSFCIGEGMGYLGCTEDDGKPLDEGKLLSLSCEPLAVIRNAIFQKYGFCLGDDFNQQFFDQSCKSTSENYAKAHDKVEKWGGILALQKVERLKGCVR